MNVVALFSLVSREWRRFYRTRSRIIGSIASPLVLWLILGLGLDTAFPQMQSIGSGRKFLEYFFPGSVVLTVLFTSIFANISVIEDRREGFLQSVIVAPLGKGVLAGSKILGGSLLGCFQGLLFLSLAPMAHLSLNPLSFIMSLTAIFVLSLSLTSLGFIFAWWMDSVQGFHGIMNLLLFPMWLVSSAFFPLESSPIWLQWVIQINPVSYGVMALQHAFYPLGHAALHGNPTYIVCIGILSLFSFAFFSVSLWVLTIPSLRKSV